MYKIIFKGEPTPKMHVLKILAPEIAKKAKPGQFVVLRIWEGGERIPITIADTDPLKGTITLVIQEVGKTTSHIGTFKAGDSVLDVVGPLGHPSPMEKYGTVVCVGGGFGSAALHPIARKAKEIGNHVISIIGARSKDLLLMEEEMKKASSELLIATDDGSYGYHGFVTGVLKDFIEKGKKIDMVYAIGPVPMMKAVSNMTKPCNIKTVVSLNPIMIDATGMCGVCRVTIAGKTKFACVDGPDFYGHDVDFDELVKRQKMYLVQEKQSMDRFHKCKLEACISNK